MEPSILQFLTSWQNAGVVSFFIVGTWLILTGRLVPGKYFRQLNSELSRTQTENDQLRETNRRAVDAICRMASAFQQLNTKAEESAERET